MIDSTPDSGVPGLPSKHIIGAALRVARMVDEAGSEVADLRRSYFQHASGGYYSEEDMARGETLLLELGLLRRQEERLFPTASLAPIAKGDASAEDVLVASVLQRSVDAASPETIAAGVEAMIDDPRRREEALLALGARFDDAHRRRIGLIGEQLVLAHVRAELDSLGRADLANEARQVSLISDALGYDINAPRVLGNARLLEVKSFASVKHRTRADIFLSRNEAETGNRYDRDWFVVVCQVTDVDREDAVISGWCTRRDLDRMLPTDPVDGHWESTRMDISLADLNPGIPRPS